MVGEGRGMPAGHLGREGTKSVYTGYREQETRGHSRADEEETALWGEILSQGSI